MRSGLYRKVIIAPDSFKGCLAAREVAHAVASALHEGYSDREIVEFPLADGGEGTVDVVIPSLGGTLCEAVVSDPLGRPVTARYGLSGDMAVVEVAEACGLKYLAPRERNPLVATSYGVGELLMAARTRGVRRFLIGLGGTATCDGGAGMMRVPGLREALKDCSFELLCDVSVPFVGPQGAVRVFAPQKGAAAGDLPLLEDRMAAFARTMHAETGVDVLALPGTGAAGGLAGAFMAYFKAVNVSGIDRILDLTGFDAVARDADLIITGEGKSDLQTLTGKVPLGVLRRSRGVPVVLLSGRVENREALAAAGFSRLLQVSPDDLPLEEAMKPEVAVANLRAAVSDAL